MQRTLQRGREEHSNSPRAVETRTGILRPLQKAFSALVLAATIAGCGGSGRTSEIDGGEGGVNPDTVVPCSSGPVIRKFQGDDYLSFCEIKASFGGVYQTDFGPAVFEASTTFTKLSDGTRVEQYTTEVGEQRRFMFYGSPYIYVFRYNKVFHDEIQEANNYGIIEIDVTPR